MKPSYLLQLLWFYVGLLIVSAGFGLIIRAGLGAGPWDIFHLGLHQQTGLSLALAIQFTGMAIVGLNLLMRIKPTVGMLLNMLSVGPLLQFLLPYLPQPEALLARSLLMLLGILLSGLGTALYVSAGIGTGPRDGMMIGLTRRLGLPVAVIRNGMEIVAALIGWWMGGPLGLGTILVALGSGPAVQLGMYIVGRLSQLHPFSTFVQPVALKRA